VIALLLVLAGCGSSELSLQASGGGATNDDYAKALSDWTRSVEVAPVSEGFDNVLSGDATYRSWPFREAYARRYAKDHHLSRARLDEVVAQERAAHEAAHEFFLSIYAVDRRSLELGTPESIWRVSLTTDAHVTTEPSGVEFIRRPTATVRAYYPYATTTRMTFVVRFPREVGGRPVLPESTKWFELHFDGPRGHAEMKWELR
jgi:hypothetical protein